MSDKKVMVSACTNLKLKDDRDDVQLIPVCPEEIGGLITPRSKARIVGKGGSADGIDVLNGNGTTTAILKNAGIQVVNDVDYHEALNQYKEK